MPRNDGMEIEVQAEYPEHGTIRDAAAELSDLPYVRFTQRTPVPPDPQMVRQRTRSFAPPLTPNGMGR